MFGMNIGFSHNTVPNPRRSQGDSLLGSCRHVATVYNANRLSEFQYAGAIHHCFTNSWLGTFESQLHGLHANGNNRLTGRYNRTLSEVR